MNEQIACPRCLIGNLHEDQTTYSCIHNGMLLSVPNMPVWKCDLCSYQEFDYDTLTKIEALVGRFGPPDDPVKREPKAAKVDSDTPDAKQPNRIKP